ncbi:S41 family peptidase [Fusibacter sp. Q10-2]|uniref:S41 family peptidase n=2 Tax=Fusibacter ferrireducens TaxID=2785058 RepID=A0ABR9ZZX4_9FIRM|nr:S41 family peptidase [Fusibacter ferrireducens]
MKKNNIAPKKKTQSMINIRSILALLLILLLIGTAISPVFSETVTPNRDFSYESKLQARGLLADNDAVDEGEKAPETTPENTTDNAAQNTDDVSESTDVRAATYKDYAEFMLDYVNENYYKDVDQQKLIDGIYKGIFETLDKHSVYFTPEEYSEFNTDINGEFSGIGAVITNGENYVEVVSPIKETPAYEAGLLPGDRIATVNDADAKGWTTEKAISVIRGPAGTPVKIGILRNNSDEILYFDIVRAVITVKSVNYEMKKDNIGYIEITQFGDKTNAEFDEAIQYMIDNNVKKLVLDVRNNPGGYLDSAIHISDYFVEKGKEIVKVVYKDTTNQLYRAEKLKLDMDVVVLVNEGSASASEILSGTIQQNGTGIIVGDDTYGKGTVQNIVPLTNGGSIKLTIAEYLVPNDYHVDQNGIHPDVVVHGVTPDQRKLYSNFVPMNEKAPKYRGEISLNVYGAQQRLKFLDYEIDVDGKFGPKTEQVIKAFQASVGLRSTGVLNLETVSSLNQQAESMLRGEFDPQLNKAIELLKAK